jgi:hypothetical protein
MPFLVGTVAACLAADVDEAEFGDDEGRVYARVAPSR